MSKKEFTTDEKYYDIKVPVFVTEKVELGEPSPINPMPTYDSLIGNVKKKIEEYHALPQKISNSRKTKTIKKEVSTITYTEHQSEDIPMLLLKISAGITNLKDGFFYNGEKQNFNEKDLIGSDNNFMLLYPYIEGITSKSFRWIVLVYEDPNKEVADILETAKLTLKYLGIEVKNVKLETILQDLSRTKNDIDVELAVRTLKIKEEAPHSDLTKYVVSYSANKEYNYLLKVPIAELKEMIKSGVKRFISAGSNNVLVKYLITKDRKEYKISHQLVIQEGKERIKQVAEEIFNYKIRIYEEDLESNVYQPSFVKEKLLSVLTNYLSTSKG